MKLKSLQYKTSYLIKDEYDRAGSFCRIQEPSFSKIVKGILYMMKCKRFCKEHSLKFDEWRRVMTTLNLECTPYLLMDIEYFQYKSKKIKCFVDESSNLLLPGSQLNMNSNSTQNYMDQVFQDGFVNGDNDSIAEDVEVVPDTFASPEAYNTSNAAMIMFELEEHKNNDDGNEEYDDGNEEYDDDIPLSKKTKFNRVEDVEDLPEVQVQVDSDEVEEESEEEGGFEPNHERVFCTCLCVEYGCMVRCCNEDCIEEWFHLKCIGLTESPVGIWFCNKCFMR